MRGQSGLSVKQMLAAAGLAGGILLCLKLNFFATTSAPAVPPAAASAVAGDSGVELQKPRVQRSRQGAEAASGLEQPPAVKGALADPAWLGAPADRSPRAVLGLWAAYARTQASAFAAADELIAYAKAHSERETAPDNPQKLTYDAWLFAMAQDPQAHALLSKALALGYLDDALSKLAADPIGAGSRQAQLDLKTMSSCDDATCSAWRAMLHMAPRHAAVALQSVARQITMCGRPLSDEEFFQTVEAIGQQVPEGATLAQFRQAASQHEAMRQSLGCRRA